MATCIACNTASTSRRCSWCDMTIGFCSIEHEIDYWLYRHKDECTLVRVPAGHQDLLFMNQEQLRTSCSENIDGQRVLLSALLSVKCSMRGSTEIHRNNFGDCILLSEAYAAVGEATAAHHVHSILGFSLSSEPYDSEEQTSSVYKYIADKCADAGDHEGMANTQLLHYQYLEQTKRENNNLAAADLLHSVARSKAADGSFDEALGCWELAVQIESSALQSATTNGFDAADIQFLKHRLLSAYQFGTTGAFLAGKFDYAATSASQAANLLTAMEEADAASKYALFAGCAFQAGGDPKSAIPWLTRAFEFRKQKHGEDAPDTISARKVMNAARKAVGLGVIKGPKLAVDKPSEGSATSAFSLAQAFEGILNTQTPSKNRPDTSAPPIVNEQAQRASDGAEEAEYKGDNQRSRARQGGGARQQGYDNNDFEDADDDFSLDEDYDPGQDEFIGEDDGDEDFRFSASAGQPHHQTRTGGPPMAAYAAHSGNTFTYSSDELAFGPGAIESMDGDKFSWLEPFGHGADLFQHEPESAGPVEAPAAHIQQLQQWEKVPIGEGLGPLGPPSEVADFRMGADMGSPGQFVTDMRHEAAPASSYTGISKIEEEGPSSSYPYPAPGYQPSNNPPGRTFDGGINDFIAFGSPTQTMAMFKDIYGDDQLRQAAITGDTSTTVITSGKYDDDGAGLIDIARITQRGNMRKMLDENYFSVSEVGSPGSFSDAMAPNLANSGGPYKAAASSTMEEQRGDGIQEVYQRSGRTSLENDREGRMKYAPRMGSTRLASKRKIVFSMSAGMQDVPDSAPAGESTDVIDEASLEAEATRVSTWIDKLQDPENFQQVIDAYKSYGNLQRLVEAAKIDPSAEPAPPALMHAKESIAAFERALQQANISPAVLSKHNTSLRPYVAHSTAGAGLEDPLESAFDVPSRPQKGLLKPIDNLEGRRIKAVYMSADDLAAVLASKAFALGLCKMAGKQHKLQRIRSKLMAVGANRLAKRMRVVRRVAIKMFSFTVLMHSLDAFEKARRNLKLVLVGSLASCIKVRNRHQTSLNAVMLGFMIRANNLRRAKRRLIEAFAIGIFPTILRTKGNPGGFKYGQKRAASTGPRVKQIFWDTVSDVKGTLWAHKTKPASAVLRDLFPDMKDMFTEKVVEKKKPAAGTVVEAETKLAKPKAIEFLASLDSKRAYNMSIAMSKFKRFEGGFESLKRAIQAVDLDTIGGIEALDVVLAWKPLPAEVERGKSEVQQAARKTQADASYQPEFGFLEKFVIEIGSIARLSERLECMRLKVTFGDAMAVEERNVALLDAACREILDNKKLVEFLVEIIRPFGNELNRGTKKGGAQGIKISGLQKLAQTKTADGSISSLYYIINVLDRHRPHLLSLCYEFPNVREAQRLQFSNMDASMKEMSDQLAKIGRALDSSKAEKDDAFIESFAPFLEKISKEFQDLKARHTTGRDSFQQVCRYLAEEPDAQPDVLFTEWTKFVKDMQNTVEYHRIKKEKAEKAATQALSAKPKPTIKSPQPDTAVTSSAARQTSAFDVDTTSDSLLSDPRSMAPASLVDTATSPVSGLPMPKPPQARASTRDVGGFHS